jgi:hypothetical protein
MTALINLRNNLRSSANVRASATGAYARDEYSPSLWQRVKDMLTEMSSVPDAEIGWLGMRFAEDRHYSSAS